MEEYMVKVPYQGCSRGCVVYKIRANSEEALENFDNSYFHFEPDRDDTEKDFSQAEISDV